MSGACSEPPGKWPGIDPLIPIVFITASAASATAIEAMKLGALDCLLKPLDPAQFRLAIGQALKIRIRESS